MDKEFTLRGFWNLPETPDEEVAGDLSFSPGESLKLELLGTLTASKDGVTPPDFIEPPLIHGFTVDGKEVTLSESFQVSGPVSIPGVHLSSFKSHFGFIGVHFSSPADIRFKKISVRFSNLEDWSNKKGFFVESVDNDWRKPIIRYEQPKTNNARIDDYEIRLVLIGPYTLENQPTKEIHFAQTAWFEISSMVEKPFSELLPFTRKIQNLLSFAMGVPVYPIQLKGVTSANKQITSSGIEHCDPVDIYYPVPYWPSKLTECKHYQMMFTLSDIEENFGLYFTNWLKCYDALNPVLNLYFSTIYNANSYVEIKFLSMAQAIETYHRRVFGGKYQDDEIFLSGLYQTLVNALPTNLTPSYRISLIKGKLRYANEYSLRRRLKELIKSIKEYVTLDFVSNKKEQELFIENVVDTRNYLTHYPIELEKKVARDGKEIIILMTKLQLLLEVCLLKELGLEKDLILKTLLKNNRVGLIS